MYNTDATATATWGTVVEMQNVVKYFDRKRPTGLLAREKERVTALSGVSLEIGRGEFVAYAGPNGAGKSTTFKLLCGMLKAQSGTVRAFGLEPCRQRVPLMRRTGVLFGGRNELWWDHPVRSSFEWKKHVWDIRQEVYDAALFELTELMGLGELMGVFARELSLGQRQKCNLALTLLHAPELVLLDEPTLGLDVLAKREMIGFLKKVNREMGVTVLVTSHDVDDLAEMAGRLILVNRGRIAYDGPFEALAPGMPIEQAVAELYRQWLDER